MPPNETLTFLWTTLKKDKSNPTTTKFIVYLLDAWKKAVPHFHFMPPFLSRWVKATLIRYTRLMVMSKTGIKMLDKSLCKRNTNRP
jgi:hypothetical protein